MRWQLALLLLPALLPAQDTAKLFPLKHSADGWSARNATRKVITAYVIQTEDGPLHLHQTQINVVPAEVQNQPIPPGATVSIPLKPDIDVVHVPALIFEDGTVVGSAVTVEGLDVVAEIFRYREEEYKALQHLANLLADMDHARAIANLRTELRKPLTPQTTANDEELTGRYRAYSRVRYLVDAPDSDELYANIKKEVELRLAF